MNADFDQKLEEARKLVRDKRHERAEQIIEELLKLYPQRPQVHSLQAYFHERRGDKAKAIEAVSVAIAISAEEPAYYFKRGRYFLVAGQHQNAIEDFSRVLQLGGQFGTSYYEMAAYFFRAEAFLRSGNVEKAEADCTHVDDGFDLWIDGLRSKEDILADCRK